MRERQLREPDRTSGQGICYEKTPPCDDCFRCAGGGFRQCSGPAEAGLHASAARSGLYLDGLYWGANVGYSWGEAKRDLTLQVAPGVFGTASRSREVDGVIGGFQTGYNYQFGNWVWGFETDIQASGQKGSEVFQLATAPPPTFLNTEDKLTWFGTSRSRLGVLWTPNLLAYGTFGVAYGQVKETPPSPAVGSVCHR